MKFFKNIVSEFKQIEWLSRGEVFMLSMLVVFISTLIGIYIGVFDISFTSLLTRIGII